MTFNNKRSRYFALSTLAGSLLLAQGSAYALQEMNEQDMRKIDGQDGIYIGTEYDRIDVDKVYWEDKAGTASNSEESLRAYANGVSITPNVAGEKIGAGISINTGSNGTTTGIDLDVNATLGTVAVNSLQICNETAANETAAGCDPSIGSLALQSSTPVQFHLNSQDGFFSETGQAELTLGLRNINVYLGQQQSPSITNQLIMRNFNFNFFGQGNMFVSDTGGLRFQTGPTGYVDFTRVNDPQYTGGSFNGSNPGLNLEFMHKSNAVAGVYSTDGAKGIIRVGASGRMKNAYLVVRGVDARDASNNILGYASNTTAAGSGSNASVIGSTGIGFRMKGEFTRDAADADGGTPTTLELGGAGKNAYGVEFGKLTPLLTRTTEGGALNSGRAYFDSGDVYINLANTKTLSMPENSVLNTSKIGNTDTLTKPVDYTQQIHGQTSNPSSVVIGVRGMEFQALSRRARFIVSSDVTSGMNGYIAPNAGLDNTWGIGLPIYNLNANIATYGTTYTGLLADGSTVTGSQRLGFAAALSTEGVSSDGSKTTSIFLIDGGPNANDGGNPTDYYFGLRNIDMYLKGYGSVGVENGKLNVDMPNLLIAMSTEIAAGYLPGAKYKTCPDNGGSCYSPLDNFKQKTDVLFGLKIKLDGAMNFALVPSEAGSLSGPQEGANRLGFIGSYNINNGAVQIVEPTDGSILGLDNISGRVGFDNAIVVNQDNVGFNVGLKFNPNQTPGDVFRVKDINLYPAGGTAQRLGEMVITGGTLNANMTIVPRN
ncbi:DUF6160 family protein [Alkanindiges illinoisensis]|uniref:DUF6160 domain-containing protein n=1 Tax=Alkanindiges illinoisensis TaxID=197183 RepID=A0A4Y7X9Z1_9GAMM|nr:DUF6160 family protein [Alkanindiges illinoisensis]TEU24775.1 hypothetical protein E2B99_11835 [Alkanindiges illinoisensis]